MARDKVYTVRCVESGCREFAVYEYERKTDPRVKDWKCSRHRRPEEVLTLGAERTAIVTVEERKHGKFWIENGKKSGSGFIWGPGFRAFAKDFAAGTRLVITARIEADESNVSDSADPPESEAIWPNRGDRD